MKYIILVLVVIIKLTFAQQQFYNHQQEQQHQPIPYALQPPPQQHQQQPAPITEVQLAHRAVIENSLNEAQLPAELARSINFYKHPKIAEALAKDSWLTDKEMPVFDREAEKIPREQVYKIFKNAGFIHRKR